MTTFTVRQKPYRRWKTGPCFLPKRAPLPPMPPWQQYEKKSRQTLLVLLLPLALLAALSLFLLAQKVLSRPADTEVSSAYWIYAAGTAYDEKSFQNVYEIHLVAENPEKITEELWQEEFYRYAKNWWTENPDTEIRYLWIYTYDTVEDARRKETPVHSGYTYYKSETDK